MDDKKTYVCLGSCQAEITEIQYNNGLIKCGAKECTFYEKPFVEGKKSETTGKNEAADSINSTD
jgi:hypothetical protein